MPFNEELGERIRECFESSFEVTERKMFGGLAFMVGGHMCCGVIGDDLMVRVGPDDHDRYLALPHARPMDFTGRPMKGFLYVAPDGTKDDAALRSWVDRGISYARSLPPKKGS